MPFQPKFTITARVASDLMCIEGARQAVQLLPITPVVLANLRQSAWSFFELHQLRESGCRLVPRINYFAAHPFEWLDVTCHDSMAA